MDFAWRTNNLSKKNQSFLAWRGWHEWYWRIQAILYLFCCPVVLIFLHCFQGCHEYEMWAPSDPRQQNQSEKTTNPRMPWIGDVASKQCWRQTWDILSFPSTTTPKWKETTRVTPERGDRMSMHWLRDEKRKNMYISHLCSWPNECDFPQSCKFKWLLDTLCSKEALIHA